ncbi:unnamed protein product [Acanthosepion pharaonis]|uniref:Uncharacterized protein n=1 Tax=Acanthosepion pharaonis TaxID=158019 RepID=A0A812BUM9_ACAPH|nr:unnamed protein product [Sepia pharaonis]
MKKGHVGKAAPLAQKGYPRKFISETQTATDGYPLYSRRSPDEGGRTVTVKGHTLDNRWVVPYCPLMFKTFGAHINVEYFHSVKSIKYICKYVNKGSDAAVFGIRRDNCVDEVADYVAERYLSSSEAFWRILGFPYTPKGSSHCAAAVHLENGQRMYITEQNAQQVGKTQNTTLTAFFLNYAQQMLLPNIDIPPSPVPTSCGQTTGGFGEKAGNPVEGYPDVWSNSCLGRVYTMPPPTSQPASRSAFTSAFFFIKWLGQLVSQIFALSTA